MFRLIWNFKGAKARPWTTVFTGIALLAYAKRGYATGRVALTGFLSSCLAGVGESYEF